MRATLLPLLTVLLSAIALFGFAAAHQDFTELEARHVPSSYLRSRDLSFSDEDFGARDGFNSEYEGLQARGEALEVPFQLSLRDFLEEAVEVYRRSSFTLLLAIGNPIIEQIPLPVTPQTTVDQLYKEAGPTLGFIGKQPADLANLINLERGSQPGKPLQVRGDMRKTMSDLGITAEDNFVLAIKKEPWPLLRGSPTRRPLQTQANGSKKPAKAPAQTPAKKAPAQKKVSETAIPALTTANATMARRCWVLTVYVPAIMRADLPKGSAVALRGTISARLSYVLALVPLGIVLVSSELFVLNAQNSGSKSWFSLQTRTTYNSLSAFAFFVRYAVVCVIPTVLSMIPWCPFNQFGLRPQC
ncbi:hypothetical protein DFP72DRAFT_1053428 [Ephemerocybe angulata]|uniref:Uncharacterized protein n=1 Tax=Ephemerocybe angulata TaxID=980116 RepID=A0A8H6LWC1_9AGAR|nr:hypothetical protein DFP72DRAFT_1053428 [Tulosesus angulatus]